MNVTAPAPTCPLCAAKAAGAHYGGEAREALCPACREEIGRLIAGLRAALAAKLAPPAQPDQPDAPHAA